MSEPASDPANRVKERSVSVSRVVDAPPEVIFDLLADPSRHPELDGSDSVKGSREGSQRLHQGARFGMDMRIGVPYRITNEVVEFEEGRRIAWRHMGHHVWRWELEPVEGGRTKVTETFDWSTARAPKLLELGGFPGRNEKSIEQTLERLEQRFRAAA